MHGRISLLVLIGLLTATMALAQKPVRHPDVDTSFTDYDVLFNELDALLDSLTAPRSFLLFNIAVSSNYFNYESKTSYLLKSAKKLTYTPTLAYFSKTGLGISGTVLVVNDGQNLNPYQEYLTASY